MHASVPRCRVEVLNARFGQGDGAAGTTYYTIVFTNTGPVRCSLAGFPGVSSVDAAGHRIGPPAARDGTAAAKPVVLAPGGSASAVFGQAQALNFPRASCRPTTARALRIYPPDETRWRILALAHLTCAGTTSSSTIRAVVRGVTGLPK